MNCTKCGAPLSHGCPKCFYPNSVDDIARDAARYRWLRDNTYVEGFWIDGAGGVDTKIRVQGSDHFLDEAVDRERDKPETR